MRRSCASHFPSQFSLYNPTPAGNIWNFLILRLTWQLHPSHESVRPDLGSLCLGDIKFQPLLLHAQGAALEDSLAAAISVVCSSPCGLRSWWFDSGRWLLFGCAGYLLVSKHHSGCQFGPLKPFTAWDQGHWGSCPLQYELTHGLRSSWGPSSECHCG